MFRVLLLVLSLSTQGVSAHEEETLFINNVKVEGRSFSHSCSYYSNTETELQILFRPITVDYGTRIYLQFGWAGENGATHETLAWFQKTEKEMELVERGLWTTHLNQIIAERSSPIHLTALNFVFRIEEPGKQPTYVGGEQPNDHYMTRVIPTEKAGCVGSGTPLPEFQDLVVQINRPN